MIELKERGGARTNTGSCGFTHRSLIFDIGSLQAALAASRVGFFPVAIGSPYMSVMPAPSFSRRLLAERHFVVPSANARFFKKRLNDRSIPKCIMDWHDRQSASTEMDPTKKVAGIPIRSMPNDGGFRFARQLLTNVGDGYPEKEAVLGSDFAPETGSLFVSRISAFDSSLLD